MLSKKERKLLRQRVLDIIATNVKQQRERKGWSKRQLAITIAVSPSYITMIEGARREPAISILSLIATALGVRISALIETARVTKGG